MRTLLVYNSVPVPSSRRQLAIYQLLEKAIKAEKKLNEYETHGTTLHPDTYYQLVLDITEDEKQARNAQAHLMLLQMPD